MGGYGVVNVIGGGYSEASATLSGAPPNQLLAERGAANPEYQKSARPAHQGGDRDRPVGHAGRLLGCRRPEGHPTPVLFVAGSADDVSGYEKGTRAIYRGRGQRRSLPADVHQRQPQRRRADSRAGRNLCVLGGAKSYPFSHYADAVWDTARMNNILDHFATAYFGLYLERRAGQAGLSRLRRPTRHGKGSSRAPALA